MRHSSGAKCPGLLGHICCLHTDYAAGKVFLKGVGGLGGQGGGVEGGGAVAAEIHQLLLTLA